MAFVSEAVAANVLVGALVIFSLTLWFLAWRGWRYAREARTFLLFVAFGLYAAKSLVLLAGLFVLTNWMSLLLTSVGFDLAILLGFYLASLR